MEQLQVGDPARISGYELLGRLGAGGMGQVYLGRSAEGREVAVKVVRHDLAADPEFRRRFQREVAAIMAVASPRTVPVIGADPDGEPAWLANEYVPAPRSARWSDGAALWRRLSCWSRPAAWPRRSSRSTAPG